MAKPNQVLIEVRGGVAEVVHKPSDVEVVVRDYDVEGTDQGRWKRDVDGEPFLECIRAASRRKS